METCQNSPKSLAMLTSAMFAFGTIGIFRKYIPLSSGLLAFFRGVIGAAFLMLFVKIRGGRLRHGIGARTALWLAASGAVIGFNWILLFEAYNYTSVSIATLCYYMEPTIIVLASSAVLGEKMTARKFICSILALTGMVLISGVLDGGTAAGGLAGQAGSSGTGAAQGILAAMQGVLGAGGTRGILLGLGAAVLYAVVVLMNKKTPGVDAYEKTTIQLASAAVVLIPYLLITGGFSGIEWTASSILLLVFVGVVHTGICYALYFGAMDGLRTQTIALFSYIDPLTALLLSALILHERMTALGIVGAVLILGAAVAGELGSPDEPEAAPNHFSVS